MLEKKQLEGVWILKDFYITKCDLKKNWGANVSGMLIYHSDGYMSVSINADINNVENSDVILKSILFYSGQYRVKNNLVFHEVKNASDPKRINQTMIREVILENNELTLIGKGEFGTSTLRWLRSI